MIMMRQFFSKSRQFVVYGAIMAVLVFSLKWLQWKFLITDNSSDIYIGIIALLFTGLGIWVALQLAKPRTVVVEKEIYITQPETPHINQAELDKLNLTAREYEVLQLLTRGCSNGEIADKLFLSLSTVKTHVSNLFVKMGVRNRTQAIEKANRLKLTR
jgi:NarL family two-component system response regulator LiaR